MEGIFNILASEGIEIEAEMKKRLNKKISSEYKTIAEFSELKKKLEESNNKALEYQNLSKDIEDLQNKNSELNKQYETAKIDSFKFHTLKSGVNEKFVDFVTSEVLKTSNNGTDFVEALGNFNKENPQYICTPTVKVSTTPLMQNKTENGITSNELINNFIRGKIPK